MHNPIQGGPTIGKDWVMEPLQSSSELALRAFISHELPKTTDKIVDEVVRQVAYAGERFTRYSRSKKAKRHAFTYISKLSSCGKITRLAKQLSDEINGSDLMVLDELDDYLGGKQVQIEIAGYLKKLELACEELSKTVPTNTKYGGRPVDRILYDWVLNMARIYEELFKPKKKIDPKKTNPRKIDPRKIDHSKKGKFMKFMECWLPEEFPIHGDTLTPRKIESILKFRKFYKDDLRNTFFNRASLW